MLVNFNKIRHLYKDIFKPHFQKIDELVKGEF